MIEIKNIKQASILMALEKMNSSNGIGFFFSPSWISKRCGKGYNSSWACRHLKKLCELGIVSRCDKSPLKGHYRITGDYTITTPIYFSRKDGKVEIELEKKS